MIPDVQLLGLDIVASPSSMTFGSCECYPQHRDQISSLTLLFVHLDPFWVYLCGAGVAGGDGCM